MSSLPAAHCKSISASASGFLAHFFSSVTPTWLPVSCFFTEPLFTSVDWNLFYCETLRLQPRSFLFSFAPNLSIFLIWQMTPHISDTPLSLRSSMAALRIADDLQILMHTLSSSAHTVGSVCRTFWYVEVCVYSMSHSWTNNAENNVHNKHPLK